jgi:hypothetical protein
VLSAEEIQWQHAAANDILNMEIVRVTPVNSDSEDEETMERVTSPVVVEAVSDLADVNSDSEDEETMERVTSPVVVEAVSDVTDTNEATGSADNVVNNSPNLVIAEEGDYVEEVVECRAEVPSDPGPFSEDVTMDDFLPRPSRGSVVFLAFSDW